MGYTTPSSSDNFKESLRLRTINGVSSAFSATFGQDGLTRGALTLILAAFIEKSKT